MLNDDTPRSRVNCPCCGYPTLTERGGFEICDLCNWEDDGQDDYDADIVRGGPNQGYSLTMARRNFAQYLVMYDPARGDPRIGGPDSELELQAKQAMIAAFDRMKRTTSHSALDALWASVLEAETVLNSELERKLREQDDGAA